MQHESTKQKRAILAGLQREVDDFHPLLEQLLPKLPLVKAVEYTHGRDEFGADFVVSRENDLLGSIDYIGVSEGSARTSPRSSNRSTNVTRIAYLREERKKFVYLRYGL